MVAFPTMLVAPAKDAGIEVPDDLDNYDKELYPHFFVFCVVQLGRPMPHPSAHFDNAKIIGKISLNAIRQITPSQLMALDFQ